MHTIRVNQDSCSQCGACADICYARGVFEMTENGAVAAQPEICRFCGHCVAVCPTDSVVHSALPMEDCPLIEGALLPSAEMMLVAMRARRSYRRYKKRLIPRAVIQDLISHSRYIPTGGNRQFLDWVVLDDEQSITELLHSTLLELRESTEKGRDASRFLGGLTVDEVDDLIDLAVHRRRRFFFNAPVVLAGYCDAGSLCTREEATYAAYNITLLAERVGLGTCHIGSIQLLLEEFSHLQREVLGIPDGKELQVILTLGYPAWEFRRLVPRRTPDIKWNP